MRRLVTIAGVCCALAGSSAADPLTAGKSTVDGGGVSFASAGSFVLGGTIGQPDAGSLIWMPYVVVGGFWGGSVGSTVSIGEDPGTPGPPPLALRIVPPRPNPMSSSAALELELPVALDARVEVYDVRGALVRSLLKRELPAGRHRVEWDGRDDQAAPVKTGLYLFRIRVGAVGSTEKVAVVR
jgi:hypothetical protein